MNKEKIEIKINRDNFPLIDMLLFELTPSRHLNVEITFFDSEESYEYETIEYDGHLVFITK